MPPRPRRTTLAGQQEAVRSSRGSRPAGALPTVGNGPILETDFVNVPLRDRRSNWTSKRVGGRTFMTLKGPRWAWVPVHDQDDEYDAFLTGLSGTVVQKPRESPEDMPFTHPFGHDFEFHVAPDDRYVDLVGPNMQGSYAESTKHAKDAFGLNVPGVIGMEWDSGMVPKEYRPKLGHRVCLFGRWIIDAGHDDFHTEIHPPLLMVSASEERSSFQAGNARSRDATVARILARPFLVSQQFDNRGLMRHLVGEVAQVTTFQDDLMEANPTLLPPYVGMNVMMFKVRPPTPSSDPRDELWVEWDLVTRDAGTAIQIVRGTDGESVRVVVVLNRAGYAEPKTPIRRKRRLGIQELVDLAGDQGDKLKGGVFGLALLNPATAPFLLRGVETSTFKALAAPALGGVSRVKVSDLRGDQNIQKDPSQPFPLAGFIKVEWKRFNVAMDPGPVAGGN